MSQSRQYDVTDRLCSSRVLSSNDGWRRLCYVVVYSVAIHHTEQCASKCCRDVIDSRSASTGHRMTQQRDWSE